jgi:hypothetical protein
MRKLKNAAKRGVRKAVKRPPRQPSITEQEPVNTAELVRTAYPVGPPLHSPTGQIIKAISHAKRGGLIRHLVTDVRTGRQWFEDRPVRPSRPEPSVTPPRPRGAPRKHPELVERLRADLAAYPTHSQRQRAVRLGLKRSTLRRYLPLA